MNAYGQRVTPPPTGKRGRPRGPRMMPPEDLLYATVHKTRRKARKTYCFSKDWDVHEAVTYFTMYSYNFCWAVRTLHVRGSDGRRSDRSRMVPG